MRLFKVMAILFFALVSTWLYMSSSLLSSLTDITAMINQIFYGEVGAPFAYRVLTPAILVNMGNSISAHITFHLLGLLVFFALVWTWAERWGANPFLVSGLAVVALGAIWNTYYGHAYSLMEWVLWLAGLTLLTGRWWRSGPQTAKPPPLSSSSPG